MNNQQIFLTGATGFVGRHILVNLLESDIPVIAMTHQKESAFLSQLQRQYNPNLQILISDILNKTSLPDGVTYTRFVGHTVVR